MRTPNAVPAMPWPLSAVAAISPRPLLLIHGATDDNVYFQHSVQLADALYRDGKPFEFLPLLGTHMITDPLTRLRREAPIHYLPEGQHGPFWSVTKYKDIVQVDTNHQVFSSESSLGGITLFEVPSQMRRPNFISMDPPKHDAQRMAVSPIVAPANLAKLESLIRSRAVAILESLPRDETFNWVDKVSIELTTQMLATLFDFPFEDRRLLTHWSDVATTIPAGSGAEGWARREAELMECAKYFTRLWNERVNAPPRNDLVSMLAHGEATRNMSPQEFMGNVFLLIVGGNDTTRNSMSGGLHAMITHPGEWQKLRDNPSLISSAVPEIVRWQTPVLHMRRTATRDTELGGKTIRKGDKVIVLSHSADVVTEVLLEARTPASPATVEPLNPTNPSAGKSAGKSASKSAKSRKNSTARKGHGSNGKAAGSDGEVKLLMD